MAGARGRATIATTLVNVHAWSARVIQLLIASLAVVAAWHRVLRIATPLTMVCSVPCDAEFAIRTFGVRLQILLSGQSKG